MTIQDKIESLATIYAESGDEVSTKIHEAMIAVLNAEWTCDDLTDDALAEWAFPDGDAYADRIPHNGVIPADCVASDSFSDGNDNFRGIYAADRCIDKIIERAIDDAEFAARKSKST